MKKLIPCLLIGTALMSGCSNVTFHSKSDTKDCAVGSYSKDDLLRIKQSGFEGITPDEINAFALDLLPCVGDADPEMRDGIVYESLAYLLRNDKISDPTKIQLMTALIEVLKGPEDKGGFAKPFAALDLSELARADRINPYLTDAQRSELVAATASYLGTLSDYRGYDDDDGWRHGVAHTADVAMQLALNKNISDQSLVILRDAIGAQIAPKSGHAYIHGESERLARPILYMARRGTFTQSDWQGWLARALNPAPFGTWDNMFKSEAGLAKLHNTKAFVNALYVNASASENPNIKVLEDVALTMLKQMP